MKQIKFFCIFLSLCLTLISCEDFFKKSIEIESADDVPKIVVSAGLENGLFYIYLSLSNPITTKETLSQTITIKNAIVKLYEDDQLLLEITQQDDYAEPIYSPYDQYYLPYAVRQNVRVTPGKSYRLEVSYENYPPVFSTVIAPDEPLILNTYMDSNNILERDNDRIAYAEKLQDGYPHCDKFFPLALTIQDDPFQKNYYLIEVCETYQPNPSTLEIYTNMYRQAVGTTDRILIQDNPDVMANQWLNDPEINTFIFGQMLLTDLTFQGKKQTLNLLVATCNSFRNNDTSCERLRRYYPESRIIHEDHYLIATVKHVCREGYDFYRTFVLQDENLGFFTEPVDIISNIKGGYGCFSVSTSKQVILAHNESCYLSY